MKKQKKSLAGNYLLPVLQALCTTGKNDAPHSYMLHPSHVPTRQFSLTFFSFAIFSNFIKAFLRMTFFKPFFAFLTYMQGPTSYSIKC